MLFLLFLLNLFMTSPLLRIVKQNTTRVVMIFYEVKLTFDD